MKEQEIQIQQQNKFVCKIPFLIYLSGARGSGKSTTLIELLLTPDLYLHKFDKIFVFSPSLDDVNDGSLFDLLNLPKSQVFSKFTEKKLEAIIKHKKKHPDKQYLIIFDDVIGDKEFKNSDLMRTIAINGRHMNISAIVTSQKSTMGSTVIRTNADMTILYRPRSMNEIECLFKDSCINGISRKQFVRLIMNATDEKYSFLAINYTNNTCWRRYTQIPTPEPDYL